MRNVLFTLAILLGLFSAYLYARNLCMDRLSEAAWSNYDELVRELTDGDAPPPLLIEGMVGGQIDALVIEQCKDPALILRALQEDFRAEP